MRLPQPTLIPEGPGTAAGWGSTGSSNPNILQKAVLSTININICRDAFFSLNLNGNLVDDTNFCTGPLTGGLAVCSGDSGGPLIQGSSPNQVVVGVVSWGVTPCKHVEILTQFSVYKTKISFNRWNIWSSIRCFQTCQCFQQLDFCQHWNRCLKSFHCFVETNKSTVQSFKIEVFFCHRNLKFLINAIAIKRNLASYIKGLNLSVHHLMVA